MRCESGSSPAPRSASSQFTCPKADDRHDHRGSRRPAGARGRRRRSHHRSRCPVLRVRARRPQPESAAMKIDARLIASVYDEASRREEAPVLRRSGSGATAGRSSPVGAEPPERVRGRSSLGLEHASAPVLQLAPGRNGSKLEQRPPALGLRIAEVARVVDPRDVEKPFLHAVVEPGAAEDELAQPVDE